MIDQTTLDRVLKRYQKALQYSTIDPEVALGESRKTAEAILKLLYNEQRDQDPKNQLFNKPVEKKMLSDLASIMEKIKRYPLIVATAVRTIQAFGNIGAHDQGEEADHVDQDSILACTTALSTLMKWFWQEFNQDLTRLELNATTNTDSAQTNTTLTDLLEQGVSSALQGANTAVDTMNDIANTLIPQASSVNTSPESNLETNDTTVPEATKSSRTPLLAGIGFIVLLIGGWLATRSKPPAAPIDNTIDNVTQSAEQPTLLERITSAYTQANIPTPPIECQQENEQVLTELKTTPIDKIKVSNLKERIASSLLLRALLIKDWHTHINDHKNDRQKRHGLLKRKAQEHDEDDAEIKTYLQSAVVDCSNWAFPHTMLGNYWYAKEDYSAAQAEYAVALANEADNPEVLFNSTLAYMKNKEFNKALEQVNILEQYAPNHDNLQLIKTQVLVANNQFAEAEETGVKAYNDPNSSAKAALLLWQVYTKLEQPELANEYACSALKLGMEQAKDICKETK